MGSHWEYFARVENLFVEHTRDIGYTSNYYAVRSQGLADIVLAAGNGFLTTASVICTGLGLRMPGSQTGESHSPRTLKDIHPILTSSFPGFTECKVVLPSYCMSLRPWRDWTAETPPSWWTDGYLALGEDREAHFAGANYWNALYATAGLLVGILYHHVLLHGCARPVSATHAPRVFFPRGAERGLTGDELWTYATPDCPERACVQV